MQNVEPQPTILTNVENLDLAKVGKATSSSHLNRISLTDATSKTDKIKRSECECVQSDPETRRKSKARSRLTSALRKLSGRKKSTINKDTSTESSIAGEPFCEILSAPETLASSGGEDIGDTNASTSPESKTKKKSKLAKRFLLSGLKKSKRNNKKSIEEDEEGDVVHGSQEETPTENVNEADLSDDNFKDHTKRKVTISDFERSSFRATTTEEIVLQASAETNVQTVSSSETDYLSPIEDKAQPNTDESGGDIKSGGEIKKTSATLAENITTAALAGKSQGKKKKLKTKKSIFKEAAVTIIKTTATTTSGSTVPTSTQKLSAATVQETPASRATTITTDERFVITQCTLDTPPSERAPTKPNRVASIAQSSTAAINPTSTITGAVRKNSPRTTPTSSISLGCEKHTGFGAVSIAAVVAGRRHRAKGGKSSGHQALNRLSSIKVNSSTGVAFTNNSNKGAPTTRTHKVKETETETELMHSSNDLQRGHRFPKPSAIALSPLSANNDIIADSKASESATTESLIHSNVISKLAASIPTTYQTTNDQTVITTAAKDSIEQNRTKPENFTVSIEAPSKGVESTSSLKANQKHIQFHLEYQSAFDEKSHQIKDTQQQQKPQPKRQQHQVLIAPLQLSEDDTVSSPQYFDSDELLSSNYQPPSSYSPPSKSTITSTKSEIQTSTHIRHPSSSKFIFPDPGVYNDIYTDNSEALLFVANESVTTANSSGADDFVSSAESVQPSDYSSNKIHSPNFSGHPLRSDFNREEQESHSPPLQATVRFAVGSEVRPQTSSFVGPLHDPSSYDSNPSSDSRSESSRRYIRYVSQPINFDENFELNQQAQAITSEYSVDSEYDSGDNQMPAFGDLTMEQDIEPTIMTSANTEKREHLYKILVIGELGTGKTSFIKRYVHQFFSQNYRATIGVDFALKVLHWDPNTTVRLQLWDIAGQERFGNMTRVYYKEAVGAFIVFDVTRSGTFDCVSKWKEDLDSKVQLPDGSPIPCILLANKCDQEKQGIVTSPEKMDEYVRENGFVGWYETSAKENINIDEAARALVNKILLNDKLISAADLADGEKFNLNSSMEQSTTESKSKCSC
uniref:Ras-related protein Rab-32 n=2 Tax=Ceratitis capitata TaxID=7213 RepID=W8BYW0_CERCA